MSIYRYNKGGESGFVKNPTFSKFKEAVKIGSELAYAVATEPFTNRLLKKQLKATDSPDYKPRRLNIPSVINDPKKKIKRY